MPLVVRSHDLFCKQDADSLRAAKKIGKNRGKRSGTAKLSAGLNALELGVCEREKMTAREDACKGGGDKNGDGGFGH